jgi:hypothetical protein
VNVTVIVRTQSSPVLLTFVVNVPGQLSVADELASAAVMASARVGYQEPIGPVLVATGGVVSVLVVYVRSLDTFPQGSLKEMVMVRTQSSPVLLTLGVKVPGQLSVAEEFASAAAIASARVGYQDPMGPVVEATGAVVSVLVV